jgi:hypothetical protein
MQNVRYGRGLRFEDYQIMRYGAGPGGVEDPRFAEQYAFGDGGVGLTEADITRIDEAVGETDWAQWCRSKMAESQGLSSLPEKPIEVPEPEDDLAGMRAEPMQPTAFGRPGSPERYSQRDHRRAFALCKAASQAGQYKSYEQALAEAAAMPAQPERYGRQRGQAPDLHGRAMALSRAAAAGGGFLSYDAARAQAAAEVS